MDKGTNTKKMKKTLRIFSFLFAVLIIVLFFIRLKNNNNYKKNCRTVKITSIRPPNFEVTWSFYPITYFALIDSKDYPKYKSGKVVYIDCGREKSFFLD